MGLRLASIVLLALVASTGSAQDDKITATVSVQVKKMIDATVEGKYETVIDLTHAKVVDEMGGRALAIEKTRSALEAIKSKGYTFKIGEVAKPNVLKAGKDYYAVASYSLVLTGKGKKLTSNTSVVGVSTDNGETWKFVNVTAKGEAGVRRILPELPGELKVPASTSKIE
jgi:hypothetical protein